MGNSIIEAQIELKEQQRILEEKRTLEKRAWRNSRVSPFRKVRDYICKLKRKV